MATPEQTRRLLYAIADSLVSDVAVAGGVPAPVLQGFVEGIATGTADMVKGKKKGRRAVSAYNKAFGRAYKRQKAKMTKKNGQYKKGCSAGKCMSAAHRDTRKELKR